MDAQGLDNGRFAGIGFAVKRDRELIPLGIIFQRPDLGMHFAPDLVEHNGRVIKERSIQSIDPLLTNAETFKVKVRKEPKKEWVGLPADEDVVNSDLVDSNEQTESTVVVEVSQTTVVDPDTNLDNAVVTTIAGEPVVAEDGVLVDGAKVVHSNLEITTREVEDPYAYARGSDDSKEETSDKSSDTALVNHSV